MMGKEGVSLWIRELLEENPDNLNNPDHYLNHVEAVYDLSRQVVGNILSHYPGLPLDLEEISLAAGLHDIGRPLKKNQMFHELSGAQYVEQTGLEKGVAPSLDEVYKLAQMFRSHGLGYESWTEPDCLDQRADFEPLDRCLLIPRTWQEAIVTYSDLSSQNGQRVPVKKKLEKLAVLYSNDHQYQDQVVVKIIEKGKNRILEMAQRVQALEKGALSQAEIIRYGFM